MADADSKVEEGVTVVTSMLASIIIIPWCAHPETDRPPSTEAAFPA